MRLGARAFFSNPLSWQDDEERGSLVSGLHTRTRGTSYYDATAIRLSADNWRVCYWGRLANTNNPWIQVCYETNPPPPPTTWTVPFCSGATYPRQVSVIWEREGEGCECMGFDPVEMHYSPTIGLYGGWGGTDTGCGGSPVSVIVRPMGPNGEGFVRWRFEFINSAYPLGVWVDETWRCGQLPAMRSGLYVQPECPVTLFYARVEEPG